MFPTKKLMFSLLAATLLLAPLASASVTVGEMAAGFTLTDPSGNEVNLSDFDGKIRVLEWVNPECPFVKRHYKAETMKKLATQYEEDVVWLTINSTHFMDEEDNAEFIKKHDLPYVVLADANGEVGHQYDAKTTPHMFVIGADGTLLYQGAIDDDPRGKKDEPLNYVAQALDETIAGQAVSVASTKPYGCSVKYKK